MPKTQITQKMVSDLCHEIYVTTGRDPTYFEVTAALHCSNSTVKPYLQTWLDQPRPERHPLPAALADRARDLVQVIWGLAATEARQSALDHQRDLEAAAELARQHREIAIQDAEEREQEQIRLKRENAALIDERAELRVRLSDMQALTGRIHDLEGLVQSLRDERDEARLKESAARGQAEVLERQLSAIMARDATQAPTVPGRRRRDQSRAGAVAAAPAPTGT